MPYFKAPLIISDDPEIIKKNLKIISEFRKENECIRSKYKIK